MHWWNSMTEQFWDLNPWNRATSKCPHCLRRFSRKHLKKKVIQRFSKSSEPFAAERAVHWMVGSLKKNETWNYHSEINCLYSFLFTPRQPPTFPCGSYLVSLPTSGIAAPIRSLQVSPCSSTSAEGKRDTGLGSTEMQLWDKHSGMSEAAGSSCSVCEWCLRIGWAFAGRATPSEEWYHHLPRPRCHAMVPSCKNQGPTTHTVLGQKFRLPSKT